MSSNTSEFTVIVDSGNGRHCDIIYYFAVGCAVFLGIKGRDGKWPFEDNMGEMLISF